MVVLQELGQGVRFQEGDRQEGQSGTKVQQGQQDCGCVHRDEHATTTAPVATPTDVSGMAVRKRQPTHNDPHVQERRHRAEQGNHGPEDESKGWLLLR